MKQNFSVKARKGESSEALIKRFMKKTKKFKIIDEVKKKKFYEKPSDKKRMAKQRAIREAEKNIKKELVR